MYEPQPQGPEEYWRDLAVRVAMSQLAGQMSPQRENAAIEQDMRQRSGAPDPAQTFAAAKPKKKKGSYSEFFALLRKVKDEEKDGKKDTAKALKDLAKQLSSQDSVATKGNATGTVQVV